MTVGDFLSKGKQEEIAMLGPTQYHTNKNVEFRFYFDEKYRLFQRLEIDHSRKANILTVKTTYEYDDELLIRGFIYTNNKEVAEIESNYFYSKNGILDSATLKTSNGHRQRWVYDSLGLLSEEWSNNYNSGERFIHGTRE
jgi:YD repeat-containing protein